MQCPAQAGQRLHSISQKWDTVPRFDSPEILCPLYQRRPHDAGREEGRGEGGRLSPGLISVWISTQDRHWTATFKNI